MRADHYDITSLLNGNALVYPDHVIYVKGGKLAFGKDKIHQRMASLYFDSHYEV